MPTLRPPLPVGVTDDEKAALQGSVGTPSASNRYLTQDDAGANPAPTTAEPTGFPNLADSTLSFVPGSLTFTIAPAVTSFDTYSKGVKRTYSSPQNVVITNTTGLHFIYFNAAGALVSSLTPWSFGNGLVFVATVYWNTAAPTQYVPGEERHGLVMDWRTHQYLHETENTRYVTGFAISGYVLDSDTDADVTIGVENGQIDDEDLRHFIQHAVAPTNPFEQVLQDPAQIPVYYRDGVGGNWLKDAATNFPWKNFVGGNQRVAYNLDTAGTWSQAEVANNDFVAYWLFATNDWTEPVISIQGQRQDGTLVTARANNGFNSLNLGNLPSSEWKVLWRIIVQTSNGYGGTTKCVIAAVDDYRTAALQPGQAAAATAHSSLSGLPVGNDHPQYQLGSEKSQANGYASLDGTTKIPIAEIPTAIPGVIQPDDVAAEGSSISVARADHTHGITAAAPAQGIGAGNQEGSATSFSRSDHNHTIRETGGPTDLTMGAVPADNFLRRVGTAIVGFNPREQYAESAGESSTTSAAWQQKLRMTTPSIEAGDYRIEWYYEWSLDDENEKWMGRVQVDDTTTIHDVKTSQKKKYSDTTPPVYQSHSGFAVVTLTAAAHDIDLDWTQDAAKTAYIRNARLSIRRVA